MGSNPTVFVCFPKNGCIYFAVLVGRQEAFQRGVDFGGFQLLGVDVVCVGDHYVAGTYFATVPLPQNRLFHGQGQLNDE